MSKSFQQTWVKHSEDPDGTLYYRDPETGTVYMETIQGWIEA
jgi:hypothetical protein